MPRGKHFKVKKEQVKRLVKKTASGYGRATNKGRASTNILRGVEKKAAPQHFMGKRVLSKLSEDVQQKEVNRRALLENFSTQYKRAIRFLGNLVGGYKQPGRGGEAKDLLEGAGQRANIKTPETGAKARGIGGFLQSLASAFNRSKGVQSAAESVAQVAVDRSLTQDNKKEIASALAKRAAGSSNYEKDLQHLFYNYTQELWEGIDPEDRDDAIIEKLGVKDIEEALAKVQGEEGFQRGAAVIKRMHGKRLTSTEKTWFKLQEITEDPDYPLAAAFDIARVYRKPMTA